MNVVRRPNYPASTGDPAVLLQDSAFTLRNQSCDILVDGDSTANVGIDPTVLAARTGLTACNIATSRPIVDQLGTLPLDAFLQHNPPPKLIVLQYGPEVFYRAASGWQHNGPYVSFLMLTRNFPPQTALRTMLRHPAENTQFVLYILQHQLLPNHPERQLPQFHRALDHAAVSNGQLDLNLPAQTACLAPPLPLYGPVDTAWIAQLRQKYQARGIAILIRAAPIPACDPQLARFQRDLTPVVDGPVEALPISSFVAGDRHTTQPGSLLDTLGLVRLIQSRLIQSGLPNR